MKWHLKNNDIGIFADGEIAEEIFKNPLEGLEIRVKGNTTRFNEVDVLSTTFDVKRYLYPIPYNEVVKNDNMIQNPKW